MNGRAQWPGLAISAVVAVAAMFLAEPYGAPAMLFVLLLRLGVALLGLRITADR